jgi:hypothetical protein
MKFSATRILCISIGAAAASFALFANDGALRSPNASLFSTAEAIIGRPLTPMSYAGVARRTTRRAYAAGAYGAGAVGVGAYAAGAYGGYGAGCVQVVNAYGQIYMQCP